MKILRNPRTLFVSNGLFLLILYLNRAGYNMAATPEFEILQSNLKYHQPNSSLTSLQDIGRSGRSTPMSNRSISRPTSVISLASLDIQIQESESRPFSTFRDILSGDTRMSSILHLVLLSFLLFGSISDVIFRIQAEGAGGTMKYQAKRHGKSYDNDRKGILGSAMISSVTEALSPILPFAGGVDLRRDNAWKSWRNYLWIFRDDVSAINMEQATNSATNISLMPRGGARKPSRNSSSSPTVVLSQVEPFLPTKDIEDMTLREISYTLKYAVESGCEQFDLGAFLSQDFEGGPVNTRMEKAVRSIENAVQRSRGGNVLPALTYVHKEADGSATPGSDAGYGDIDALSFCAVMRIFAEWRVLRQVPPGYKGYAVGMNLGQKDVVQNVAKIERAAHEWIATRSEALESSNEKLRSPTLRQLLIHEIEVDVHPNNRLPRLRDGTAAMGLLWVRRQLHYQTTIFDNIISVPKKFPTCIKAVGDAYTEVYGNLHGWAVQKIFNYSFQSAPEANEIFRHMNPWRLQEVKNAAMASVGDLTTIASADDVSDMSSADDAISIAIGKNRNNPLQDLVKNVGSEFEKIGKHIGGEWDKAICNVSNVIKKEDKNCDDSMKAFLNTRGGQKPGTRSGMSDEDIEEYTSKEMQKDATEHIKMFLRTASPVLNDLAGLFNEMNMDDPTKV